jgi:tetratricopeptide (TPR) repeat protein
MSKRLILLVLTYLAVPVSLVLVEIGLRLWVPGLENPLVRPVSYDGIAWYEINRRYLRKYFAPDTPLIPEFKPALFRRDKSPGSIRIFCLGESSMFGTPYQMTAGIPGILRKQLRHALPDREIEVVNFGASAINSNVILDLSRELGPFQPDLVIVYMGHNEFYGPDGAGAGMIARMMPASIQWKYRLRDTRLLSWLLDRGTKKSVEGEEGRNLMREVSRGGAVPLASDDAERVFTQWEENLNTIFRLWQDRGVPLLVSDISSNLMFPPFLYDTLNLQSPALASLRGSGGRLEFDRAPPIELLKDLRKRDSTNAFIEYWNGRSAQLHGDSAGAKVLFERARDLDLLKFRAPGRINEILHRVCRRLHVPCVSTDSLFSRLSPGGIPGDTLFWEHLHPTLFGYYEIATQLAATILHGGVLRVRAQDTGGLLPFNPDSLSVCWLDRAYGDLSIRHLTGRWPFMNYRRAPDVLTGARPEQLAVAQAVYDRRIVWDGGCYQSADRFWKSGDLRAAATTYEALLEEYPFNYYPRYLLGNLLGRMGMRGEAIGHLRLSIASNPAYPQARLDLGLLLINEGRFDEAIRELSAALSLPAAQKSRPLFSGIHYGLGAAYANKGDVKGAVGEVAEAIRLDSMNVDARRMLDRLKRMR